MQDNAGEAPEEASATTVEQERAPRLKCCVEAKIALGIICDDVDGRHVIICQALQLVLLAKLDFEALLGVSDIYDELELPVSNE